MAQMTVAEMVTNLMWVKLREPNTSNTRGGLHDVRCSANWMWAKDEDGETNTLVAACEAMCDTLRALGVAVDGGKDSLSMSTQVARPAQQCDEMGAQETVARETVARETVASGRETVVGARRPRVAADGARPDVVSAVVRAGAAPAGAVLSDRGRLSNIGAGAACFMSRCKSVESYSIVGEQPSIRVLVHGSRLGSALIADHGAIAGRRCGWLHGSPRRAAAQRQRAAPRPEQCQCLRPLAGSSSTGQAR